jgi:uncharacterized lipoprotein YddW (UPF0748 family)
LFAAAAVAGPSWQEATPGQAAALNAPEPPREFRAVWVATVQNIDWPSAKNLSADQQRAEIVRALDLLASLNFNAVLLQIRPSCDALYKSELEPWSEYLTGAGGKPPSPLWDPLEVWIEEAHKRAIDLHAWINPFRARHFKAESPDAPDHIARRHPELVREYDGYEWLDPGEPAAVEHVLHVVRDVVTRYDLDGLVIDDYFYPYPKERVPFPDDASYNRYLRLLRASDDSRPPLSRVLWRQENINVFVRRLYEQVKAASPRVLVGIAPFGIWRPGYPDGIEGMDSIEKLHADARLWLREGTLDYVSPQLYWRIEAPRQSYPKLLDWWLSENHRSRHVWISNYASRVAEGARPLWPASEIAAQIALTRDRRAAPASAEPGGNILYSLKPLLNNSDIRASLAELYREPALIPQTPWLESPDRKTPGAGNLRNDFLAMVGADERRVCVAWCAAAAGSGDTAHSEPRPEFARVLIQFRRAGKWEYRIAPAGLFGGGLTIEQSGADPIDALVIAPVTRLGASRPGQNWIRTDLAHDPEK